MIYHQGTEGTKERQIKPLGNDSNGRRSSIGPGEPTLSGVGGKRGLRVNRVPCAMLVGRAERSSEGRVPIEGIASGLPR